ncbi:Transposase, IS4-like [Aromatoleum bremense]|nr:Transposase, IS4-like [Aromatoleum bremense]
MKTGQLMPVSEVFVSVPDPRSKRQARHDLSELLTVAVCAVLCGANDFVDVALWGKSNLAWLRKFLKLKAGVPSHDTFCRVLAMIDPAAFEAAFLRWVGVLVPALAPDSVVAIDGKTSRRSGGKDTSGPLHMVSAFAAGMGLVLGQRATDQKSNEITAIPELLAMLALEGTIVTIDAMGTQAAIARTIRSRGADYVLCVKDNPPTLTDSILLTLAGVAEKIAPASHFEEQTKGHGRVEVRRCWAYDAVSQLYKSEQWAGLQSFALVERERTVDGKTSVERHYYISSLPADAARIAQAVRSHWAVESVPQAHSKEVQHEPTNCVEAARKMRVGPSESAFRSGLQTTPSCCGQEPSVVSVGVKASGTYPEQVRIRETNESEPSMTRRYPKNCRQNQGRFHFLGQACRAPDYWASGGRRIGGVKLIQASVRNCGNQSLRCQGRSTSGRNHEARVPMRSTGTDRPVVVMKAGNAAGAKGSSQAVAFSVQLATGGDG